MAKVNKISEQISKHVQNIEQMRQKVHKTYSKLAVLQNNAEMMHNLLLDLLDLAQIDNNSFSINQEFFNLNKVIKNAFTVVQVQADRRKIKLVAPELCSQSRRVFKGIRGDARRYQQILINFISNALKFSLRDSKVNVNLRINEMEPMKNKNDDRELFEMLENIVADKGQFSYFVNFDLEIQDFGCGIPEDKLSSLFINFNKIDQTRY